MPTYEYECKDCGSTIDVFQSITAAPLRRTHCETCGAVRPVRRLIGTGGGVIFKGSGFYQTDYRSEGYKKAAKAETESSKPADSSTAASSADSAKPTSETKSAEQKSATRSDTPTESKTQSAKRSSSRKSRK